MTPMIIRRSQLKEIVGISPSSVDRLESAGDFPPRQKFGPGITGWSGQAVAEWVARKAGDK